MARACRAAQAFLQDLGLEYPAEQALTAVSDLTARYDPDVTPKARPELAEAMHQHVGLFQLVVELRTLGML